MIPQRVKLSGFLSYKDEQEIRFDGSQLWMLSGTNGSGKSSIFDAVTFALFGHHRGGSQSATELLNSTPAGRAGVLARIVDLERYQKLHAKADERRRELKGRLEAVANQLAGLKDVTDDELAAAVARIEAAEETRTRSQERIEQLH